MIETLKRIFAANAIERQLYPAPKIPLSFRTYRDADFDRCVEIHDANAEGRFPVGSRPEFLGYLRGTPSGLIIAESEGTIAGFGGLASASKNVHSLCFGIIHPDFQGRRIGSMLTLLRLQKASQASGRHCAFIAAVHKSMTFYQRFGFRHYGLWKGPDEKEYPVGLLTCWRSQFRRITKVLEQRDHFVKGDFRADPIKGVDAQITEFGSRYHIELIAKENAENGPGASSQ